MNEVINAHQSEVDWQENQTSNAPNGCISSTEEATIEKSSTNDNIDDKEKVLNPTHIESKTKLDLKPKVQIQHTPTTIGPCTSHQPTNNTQTQPQHPYHYWAVHQSSAHKQHTKPTQTCANQNNVGQNSTWQTKKPKWRAYD